MDCIINFATNLFAGLFAYNLLPKKSEMNIETIDKGRFISSWCCRCRRLRKVCDGRAVPSSVLILHLLNASSNTIYIDEKNVNCRSLSISPK